MADAASLNRFLDEARVRIDAALDRFLPVPPACPALLSEAMRYSLGAGGKRLRPVLVLAAADVAGRTFPTADSTRSIDQALPAACAIEFIHTYSLIHDDLPAMDDDTLRRGRPTLHVVYGDGIAVLAGDALQAEAFALLAREPRGDADGLASRKLATLRVIAEAAGATGMVGGQTIDLQAAGQAPGHQTALDADGLKAMHLRKTGALIKASAVSGAIMGGADTGGVAAIEQWAAHIGLAFQIVDDILDVEGHAAELGKTVGKDAAQSKPTYPALFGLDRSRVMAAECAETARTILREGGLDRGWLDAIADWVLTRKN